jgi:hypothetical protein
MSVCESGAGAQRKPARSSVFSYNQQKNMTPYALLLDRVDGLSPLLAETERELARRVIAICRILDTRAREDGRLIQDVGDVTLRRELGRLTEQLGRRTSRALPAATLGRAALADLHADRSSFELLLIDVDTKLTLLGH